MDKKRALSLLAARCSRRETARSDVQAQLRKWAFPEEDEAEVLAVLEQHALIDDFRYARAFATDRFRFKKWGKAKIRQALQGKGIPVQAIESALETLDTAACDAACLALMQQKARLLREADREKRKAKIIRFALSKGYDYDAVFRAWRRLTPGD